LSRIASQHGTLRALLLALQLFTMVSITIELFLLEHTESRIQWVPFVSLAVGCAVTLLVAARPTRATLLAYSTVMAALVIVGVLGIWYHYSGNVEFELEMAPELAGRPLFLAAIRGATPALAPGAIAQLGLLGLAVTFKHPRLAARPSIHQELEI
jgi:hypothetical protein